MRLGFTGTQHGMTKEQVAAVWERLCGLVGLVEARHGDCVGGDEQFHRLLLRYAAKRGTLLDIVIHPPIIEAKRAFCYRIEAPPNVRITSRPAKEYLARNHDVVDETDGMWAGPHEFQEQLRSGTWATGRYTRKQGKKLRLFWPDGTQTLEAP